MKKEPHYSLRKKNLQPNFILIFCIFIISHYFWGCLESDWKKTHFKFLEETFKLYIIYYYVISCLPNFLESRPCRNEKNWKYSNIRQFTQWWLKMQVLFFFSNHTPYVNNIKIQGKIISVTETQWGGWFALKIWN